MTATSLNGWPVIYPGGKGLTTRTIPGTSVRVTLAETAAPLLLWVASRVHYEVEDIQDNNKGGQDDGGYNYRPARNANAYSNHASGTAIDINWRKHPQNNAVRTMTAEQTRAARKIVADCDGVIFWGGDWTREVDEMHWEIAPGTTAADVAAFCKRMGIQADGTEQQKVAIADVRPGVANASTMIVKRALAAEGYKGTMLLSSPMFGTGAVNQYRKWQKYCGVTVTGIPDLKSLRLLGLRQGFTVI